MKGNYQQQAPIMKFSPKAATSSRIYLTQQYTKPPVNIVQVEEQIYYSMVSVTTSLVK